MKYEEMPMRVPSKFVKRKWAAKQTNDITKLSTFRVLMHLYRRHEHTILITAVWLELALIVWVKLG